MPDQVCCVCADPATSMIGKRWFCDKHARLAARERPHAWKSSILLVVGLVVFVAIIYLLDLLLHPALSGINLILAGVVLALVPAFIWMAFFYLQDRLEPEPKGYIVGVFLLGALLASAVGIPLVENLFRVSNWIYSDTLTTILGSILVVGFVQEFLKYAAVRYSVFPSAEFDEATDGVIYATAAGLGYATVLNIQFVIANGGVALGSSVIRMVSPATSSGVPSLNRNPGGGCLVVLPWLQLPTVSSTGCAGASSSPASASPVYPRSIPGWVSCSPPSLPWSPWV
jgi:hypothetical protein